MTNAVWSYRRILSVECGAVRAEAGRGFALLKLALKSEFSLKVAKNHEMLLSKRVSHVLGILSGGVEWIVEVVTGVKRDQLVGDDDHLTQRLVKDLTHVIVVKRGDI